MQKKRSRKNGTATDGPAPAGRRVRVRSRLVLGVAVAGLTVLAAGSPAVVSASAELNDSQHLVTLAEQTRQTLTLVHLLGDERDAVIGYVAQGRPGSAKGAVRERTARTDRQLAEVQAEVHAEGDEELAHALGRVQAVRTEAVDGKGTALAAHQAYAGVIAELLVPGNRLAELTPPRAEAALATTRPLAPLGQAVDQASATRGLLLAALAVPRAEQPPNSAVVDELTAAAQRSRVREQAALDDFARAARPDVRQTLAATVTGPEVKSADDYLARLTDRPTLSTADRKLDGAEVGSALTARIDRMRSVESTLAGQRATALAALRDDDVTALETLVALLGVLFLVAVGVSTAVARSLTRPLSVLRRGAARLATPEGSVEPVRFTGRNDEFAEVVRHLNAVRDQTVSLHTRIAGLDADRRRIIGRSEALASGREALEAELVQQREGLEAELAQLREGLQEHRRIMSTTSVSLSLRTLGLVERQLAVIEELESKEQDPDRLATLFKLDHLATVMRRHNENLLVLAGQENGHGAVGPVPLVDVMRAAVSEIERYERVDLAALPSYTHVAGHAADDISHVLAELLENATTFSPPGAKVKVSGWLLDSGDVVLSVVDGGIGVTEDRLEALNSRLSTPEAYDEEPEAEHGLGLGLYVAGRLAARHGVTAELRAGRHGGTEALVVVPAALLPDTPPVTPVHALATPGASALQLPGVIAEANENTLLPRPRRGALADPAEAAPADLAEAAPADPVETDLPQGPALDAETRPGLSQDWELPAPVAADAELPAADEELPARTAPDEELPPADQVFTVPVPDAGLAPDEELLARVVPDAVSAVDAELLSADEDFPLATPDAELPPADQVFTAAAVEAELPSAREVFTAPEGALPSAEQEFTVPVPDAGLAPDEELLARVVPDAVSAVDAGLLSVDEDFPLPVPDAGLAPDEELLARVVPDAVSAVDAELLSADEDFPLATPDAELPPADQVFTAAAVEAELPSAREVFTAPEGALPSAEQEFTVPVPDAGLAPDEELLARVVPDAVSAVDAELLSADEDFPLATPDAELPPADQVFTAAAVEAELPPADEVFAAAEAELPAAREVSTAAEADALPPAAQGVTVPEPEAAPVPQVRPVPLYDAEPLEGRPPLGQAEAAPQATDAPGPSPEGHRRAEDSGGNWLPRQGSHPDEAVTGKGLPKRTPRAVAAKRAADVRPEPPRRVDADELRRRLGGFYQGAQDGRRVVAAELAQEHSQHSRGHGHGQGQTHTDQTQTDQGDTAQEART